MRRCSRIISSPLAAVALLILLICFFHCTMAARLLPAVPDHLVHQENTDAVDGPVLRNGVAIINGDDLSASSSEVSENTAESFDGEEPAACEDEANEDECMQRRLLSDAHLDYIYTQRKGNKP